MMLSVGYQLTPDGTFMDSILANAQGIREIYFPWSDFPNGRNPFTANPSFAPWEAQRRLVEDLGKASSRGIALNLLLNGNCYGAQSLSVSLLDTIGDALEYLKGRFGLKAVTTSSPVIAEFIKANHSDIETRASVNMGIGTTQGMSYLGYCFDGYYLLRELNRDFASIDRLKRWCDSRGKKLYFLANSGCLNHCSAQTFHDNLVAHEGEICRMNNAVTFSGICRRFLKNQAEHVSLVRDMSYVRPEDIHLYERWFDTVKVATRSNAQPARVLEAYLGQSYRGNTLDLLEPNLAGELYPGVLENGRFPRDFAEIMGSCSKACTTCDYCGTVYRKVLVRLDAG
jgi:hypothetical protein